MLIISIWNGSGAKTGVVERFGWAAPGMTRSVRSAMAFISITCVNRLQPVER